MSIMRNEIVMDNFLTALGLFRKRLAKDGFCLFRAVSEQVYHTQTHYQHIFRLSRLCFQKWSDKDSYYWTEQDAMQTLSKIFRIDIAVYEVPGKPPVNVTKNGFYQKLFLCRTDGTHLDLVYPKTYIEHAGICQSIVYEVLYRRVFKLHDQLEEAVQLIREQNRSKFHFLNTSSQSESSLDTSGSSNTSGESESSTEQHKSVVKQNRGGRRVTPPLPYRIAKALDPLIYRNTELDIWEEAKREAIHRERYKFVTFSVGDKCQVVSEAGPIYHGHIQEISSDKDLPVVVFIEDLGEKQSVPFYRLRPDKSVLRSDWWYKQWRRRKEMTINNIREMLASVPPPPPHPLAVPLVQQQQNISTTTQNKDKLSTNMPTFPPPPPPSNINNRVFVYPPVPHQGGLVNQVQGQFPTVTMVANQQPPQFTAPPPTVAKQQSPVVNQNHMVAQYPRIWVPFMDDMALSQVDVNCPPSQDSTGQDLPHNDVNTLRFFYNLGVEYYRYISNMSCAIAMQNGATGPVQPIVYCHSRPPCEVRTDLTNAGNQSVLSVNKDGKNKGATTNFDLDDKSSASSDSGCETEVGNRCHVNRNDCCHENKQSESVKSDACTVSYEAAGVGNTNVVGPKTASVELSTVRQESAIDLQSNCSDMSVSDTVDGTISVTSGQEQSTSKQMRPRRKYYMYGNLKLIKPIKDVPKRFLDLLNSINAEKHRVEGEPIILASPNPGEDHFQEITAAYTFNPEAQCFVPGPAGIHVEGVTGAKPDLGNGVSLQSPLPASSTASYTMYVLHQPTLANNLSGNHTNIHLSNGTQITSSSHSNPQFPCTPLHTGFHSNQGPVFQ